MKHISVRLTFLALTLAMLLPFALAQNLAPPAPQKLTVHSNILNEDRIVWVRTPRNYERGKDRLPVLYLTDGPTHIHLMDAAIDFLSQQDRMPELIVVGIANTDRSRDLTPSHSDAKNPDGKVADPTSGGGDRFLDFIQNELMPVIDQRYRTAPYRVFAGHSYGGLMAIHILITRPDMFQAYIAASPSLWFDNQRTLHEAQDFFAAHAELSKTLFLALGGEDNSHGPMRASFEELQQTLAAKTPKDFHWDWARYPDEDHGTMVWRAYYAGLRTVFADWQTPRDPNNGMPVGGLGGMEKHYRELSARYGYEVPLPEGPLNNLGYQLLGQKKVDEAIAVFQRNVALYPYSANVYDSLGDGLQAAGKLDLATQSVQKAVEVGTQTNDPNLDPFKQHLKKLTAEANAAREKAEHK